MKKITFFLLIYFTVNTLLAQTGTKPTVKLDQNSIVKDEKGNIYPYAVWKKLTENGDYGIRTLRGTGSDSTAFLIYELNDEQKALIKKKKEERVATLPKPRASGVFRDGEKFRFDKMKDLDGVKYDFKKDTGKVVVFNFWFINCPPCKKEIPELNALVAKYKTNKEVVFIAIALDDAYALHNFLKLSPFHYGIVPDGRYYSDKHGITSYPTHVVVGRDGLVKFSTIGLASNTVYWVEKTIKEQL